jgi:hypothetical protein
MDYKELINKIPILGGVIKWLSGNDADYGLVLLLTAALMLFWGLADSGISNKQIFVITIALAPVWVPFLLFKLWFDKWMDAIGSKFSLDNGRVTLRITLPEEVFKSPEAMEFVISQIHNTNNPDNLMQTYIDGKRPLPYSFELVSIGGDVRFYVNVPKKKIKALFEANLYAQYPNIEVTEELDYTAEIPMGTTDWEWMVFHLGKKKDQEFPIKTYIDYGLDRLPKEEEKVDPMTPMLEALASMGPDERVWIQIISRPFRTESFKNGQLRLGEGDSWEKGVDEKINQMMNRDAKTKTAIVTGDMTEEMARLTPGERDTISAMERNAGKYAYVTGIRYIYAAKKGSFNGDSIGLINRSFSQYDIIGRNAIGVRWRTDAGYKDYIPGQNKKIAALKEIEHYLYKVRAYAPWGSGDSPKIFTAEELATMFHIPGKVAFTPSIGRVGSSRKEAPSNLPTGL